MPSEASSPLGAWTGTEAGLAGEANEFRTTEGDDTWSGRQEGTCCEVSVTLWWLHGSRGGGGGHRALVQQLSVATGMVCLRLAASHCKLRLSQH